MDIAQARQSGFSGLSPLTWVDMLSYFSITGQSYERWEIEAVRELDNVFLSVMMNDDETVDGFGGLNERGRD